MYIFRMGVSKSVVFWCIFPIYITISLSFVNKSTKHATITEKKINVNKKYYHWLKVYLLLILLFHPLWSSSWASQWGSTFQILQHCVCVYSYKQVQSVGYFCCWVFIFSLVLWDKVTLYSPGWIRTHYVAKIDFKFTIISWILGL